MKMFLFPLVSFFLTVSLIAGAPLHVSAADRYITHITSGFPEWTDHLQADNSGLTAADFTLTLYSGGTQVYSQAHSIPAVTAVVIDLKKLASTATCGKVTVNSGNLVFRIAYENQAGGMAEFLLSPDLGSRLGFHFSTFTSTMAAKGIAIANFGTQSVDLTLFAMGSGILRASATASLPSLSRLMGSHDTWFSGFSAADIDKIIVAASQPTVCGLVIQTDSAGSGLLFTPAVANTGISPSYETGQTECYDIYGVPVSCEPEPVYGECRDHFNNTIDCYLIQGQDGALRHGVSVIGPRFSDNRDGTVTDNKTGLIWLKNANCGTTGGYVNFDEALQRASLLQNGLCGLSDGSVPGDWRLPNRFELESLITLGFTGTALSNADGNGEWAEGDAFSNVQTAAYWTSTTYAPVTAKVWNVNFSDGNAGISDRIADKSYFWPVRGGTGN